MIRNTEYGPVKGVDDGNGTCSWKGIPYASAPQGSLRWRAPIRPQAWDDVRDASRFGEPSVQSGRLYGPGLNNRYDATIGSTLNQAVGSEDSLTLNIWSPANGPADLPVILFIHGGSNVSGYSADPVYDGANLCRLANAVVVTANYRLGLFGWLNLPQLKDGATPVENSANFATLDQIMVLHFIQNNIAGFGGNPGNVTVMGESAGAINVYTLLTSPLVVSAAPALFHRAIVLSGAAALQPELPAGSLALIQPEIYSRMQAQKLLAGLLVADGLAVDEAAAQAYIANQPSENIADYLRSKTPAEIFIQLNTVLTWSGLNSASHIPDGVVVAASPIAAIEAGNYLKVPILAGNTRDEGKLFANLLALPLLGGRAGYKISDAERFAMMMHFNPDQPATLTAQDLIDPAYLPIDQPQSGYNARLTMFGDAVFSTNRDAVLNALGRQQDTVWHYRFDWDEEAAPWNEIYGATHFFDMPFIFGNFGPSLFSNVIGGAANQAGRLALSNAMMRTVAAFARSGNPNNEALGLSWSAWPRSLVFDASPTESLLSLS